MDKVIVSQKVGGDGGQAVLGIDKDSNGNAQLSIEISYPMDKLMNPINQVIDNAIDKLEAVIPGDLDKAILEPIRAAAKAELLALLSSGKL